MRGTALCCLPPRCGPSSRVASCHGVSLTHLNGRTLADMVCERRTDLTDVWFVNRRIIPWPPEPLRLVASHALRGYLRLEDRIHERHLPA